MPLFSIVVPVYKTETYLRECVDSVINQSFTDWEIILVDDASPDNCAQICEEYSARDSRIKVIHHTKNSGLSKARNSGIHASIGKYLLFLDSDDFYVDGNLRTFSDYISRSPSTDVLFLSFYFFRDFDKKIISRIPLKQEDKTDDDNSDILLRIVKSGACIPQVGTKLVKADFIKENNIFFKDDSIYVDDWDWTHNIISHNAQWGACDCPHYMYRIRPGSLSSPEFLRQRAYTRYITFMKWVKYHGNRNTPNYEANFCLLGKNFGSLISLWRLFDPAIKPECKKNLENYSWVLDYSNEIKTTLVRFSYKLWGFSVTSLLFTCYSKFRNWMIVRKN